MAAVSALTLFSRFWDAINDPITAVLLIMTFWAHPDWSDRSKVIYMVITYCLLVLGYTCVNIPYFSLDLTLQFMRSFLTA